MNMLTLLSLVESNYYAEAPETVTGALNAVLSYFFHSSDFSISCKHLLSKGPAGSATQGQSEASFCLRGTRLNFVICLSPPRCFLFLFLPFPISFWYMIICLSLWQPAYSSIYPAIYLLIFFKDFLSICHSPSLYVYQSIDLLASLPPIYHYFSLSIYLPIHLLFNLPKYPPHSPPCTHTST